MTSWSGVVPAIRAIVYLAIPVAGLLLAGWDWRPIVLLYWLENVTVGAVTAIGLARRRSGGQTVAMPAWFFVIHYGIFTFVHGIFVAAFMVILPALAPGSAPRGRCRR